MVSMENALSPLNSMASSTPMEPDNQKTLFPPFYYSLVAIALTALVLIAYNIVVVGCCWRHQTRRRPNQSPDTRETSRRTAVGQSIPISKYRKEDASLQACSECAVCLSVFLDGEELRQLPKCNHSFHAACIDMWLYSHSNCPLCRQAVSVPQRCRPSQEESQSQQHLPV